MAYYLQSLILWNMVSSLTDLHYLQSLILWNMVSSLTDLHYLQSLILWNMVSSLTDLHYLQSLILWNMVSSLTDLHYLQSLIITILLRSVRYCSKLWTTTSFLKMCCNTNLPLEPLIFCSQPQALLPREHFYVLPYSADIATQH